MHIKFKISSSERDLELIYKLREEVFRKEDHYPEEALKTEYDKTATHFMAIKDGKLIGSLMIVLNSEKGLPIEKFLDISKLKDKPIAEVLKLAVLPEDRKTSVSMGLIVLAHEYAKGNGVKRICIVSLEKKQDNYKLYSRFGFKTIGKFNFYGIDNAYGMVLDLDEGFYETTGKKNKRKELFAKKLAEKMSLLSKEELTE